MVSTQKLTHQTTNPQLNRRLLAALSLTLAVWNLLFVLCSLSTQIIWLPMGRGNGGFMTGYAVDVWCLGVLCWVWVWLEVCVRSWSGVMPLKAEGSKFSRNIIIASFVFYVLAFVLGLLLNDGVPINSSRTQPWYDESFRSIYMWFKHSKAWVISMLGTGALAVLILMLTLIFKKKFSAVWGVRGMGIGLLLLSPAMMSLFVGEYLSGALVMRSEGKEIILSAIDYPDVFNAVSVGRISLVFMILLTSVCFIVLSYTSSKTCTTMWRR